MRGFHCDILVMNRRSTYQLVWLRFDKHLFNTDIMPGTLDESPDRVLAFREFRS
jgi:hypothetical protein